MERIKSKFVGFANKIRNEYDKLSGKMKNEYKKLTDLSFIRVIIIRGCNIDIKSNELSKLSRRFVIHLIKYLIVISIFTYQGIGSFITFGDLSYVIIVGNFGMDSDSHASLL